MQLPENLNLSFGDSTIKKLQDLQNKTNDYKIKTNCRLFPAKVILMKNKNMRTNNSFALGNLMKYKEYLKDENIYTNSEIEKLCEKYYSDMVASFDKEDSALGIPSSDELFKIQKENHGRGGIY